MEKAEDQGFVRRGRAKALACGLLLAGLFSASSARIEGSFVDPRDGQRYPTVTYTLTPAEGPIVDADEYGSYVAGETVTYEVRLGGQLPSTLTWMARNLNHQVPGSRCYGNDPGNCAEHGRLYTWEQAMQVCPDGWHLPSDDEWFLLAREFGGVAIAGRHLKAVGYGGGTNESLFGVVKPHIFWSSNELDASNALDSKVNFRWEKLQRWKGGKELYNSVRCVKD